MSKWIPTLRRLGLGLWLLRKAALALLTSLLFLLSFTLFQYASWWPTLTDNAFLVWGGSYQGNTFAELAPAMLEFSAVLASAFLPLFLLTPRPLLLIRHLGRRLFADTSATQAGGVILDDGR